MADKIYPNLTLNRFGLGDGWITVTEDAVSITVCPSEQRKGLPVGHDDSYFEDKTIVLDPQFAPLFRMIAKRLDAITKNNGACKPWEDPSRSPEDRAAWRNADPESLRRGK